MNGPIQDLSSLPASHARQLRGETAPQPASRRRSRLLNPLALFIFTAIAILYGSLIPFDFAKPHWLTAQNPLRMLGQILASPLPPMLPRAAGEILWMELLVDVAVNALLYLPLGFLLRLAFQDRLRSSVVCIALAALTLVMVSWFVECAQGLMAWRTGSFMDIILNAGGGLIGAALAMPLLTVGRLTIFRTYCRVAYQIGILGDMLRDPQRRPILMILLAILSGVTLAAWWLLAPSAPAEGALPFQHEFHQRYDVGLSMVGRSMVVWILLAGLLSLQLVRASSRKRLGLVVLATGLIALLGELSKNIAGLQGLNLSQPILALTAGGMLFIFVKLAVDAVRMSCRRKTQVPVEFDRRRRRHQYEPGATA